MNKHINRHRVEPSKKSNIVVPFGQNRVGRRKAVIVDRKLEEKVFLKKIRPSITKQNRENKKLLKIEKKERKARLQKVLSLKNK